MAAAPNNLQYWNAYLIAVYLTGDYELADKVLDSVMEIIDQLDPEKRPKAFEICELSLFRAHLHEKKGEIKKSIKTLEKKSKVIVDEVRGGETLVRLYQQNNQAGKAMNAANRLIELNQ
jgi:hypothetical protein